MYANNVTVYNVNIYIYMYILCAYIGTLCTHSDICMCTVYISKQENVYIYINIHTYIYIYINE